MSYMDLMSHFKVMFSLHRNHQYSMIELEEMPPFERDIYIDMVMNAIMEERDARTQQ